MPLLAIVSAAEATRKLSDIVESSKLLRQLTIAAAAVYSADAATAESPKHCDSQLGSRYRKSTHQVKDAQHLSRSQAQ